MGIEPSIVPLRFALRRRRRNQTVSTFKRTATARAVRFGLATAALACALVAPALAQAAAFVPPPLQSLAVSAPDDTVAVIVLAQPGVSTDDLKARVRALGKVKRKFSVISAVSADLTGSAVLSLAQDGSVLSITPDSRVAKAGIVSGTIWPQATGVSTLAGGPKAPTIAIVDSGVDRSRVADFGGRIAASVDFSGDSQSADDIGHGTLVAGLAAGSSAAFPGAAPNADIVSLRVVNADGTAVMSNVIAAADWIFQRRAQYGIRVANFSLHAAFPDYAAYDPLDAAVRRLWLTGTVVVASAGNDGPQRMVYAPANDPFVITVGASDIADTVARSDDGAAPWTSYGYTPEGFAKPELGAPGRWMIGPVPSGSVLATTFPDRVVAPGYMWMSGTSFSAPVVSGIAAQLLARHPDWTPDQVKGALMLTATTAPFAPDLSLGVGEVDAAAAAAVVAPPNPNEGLDQFVRTEAGGLPYFDAAAWNAYVGANASWTNASWTNASWTNASWTNASWTNASWTNAAFTDASWTNASWTNASWTNASWTNASWTNASWTNDAAGP
jgi:serine protease AprX